MTITGGAGFIPAGSPPGGDLHVVRAIAVGGQTIRVVFNVEPKARSAGAGDDALNASLYSVAVTSGQAAQPRCVGVRETLVPFPAYGLQGTDEVGVDVLTDRPVVVGLAYTIAVAPSIVGRAGEIMGAPYSAAFIGAARPQRRSRRTRRTGLVDFASDPLTGPVVDGSGDWAIQQGIDGTKKRSLRRMVTRKGAFSHMPTYGVLYDFKAPATSSRIGNLKVDLAQQLQQEPEVTAVSTAISATVSGATIITVNERATTGTEFSFGLMSTQNGLSVIP